MSSPAITTVITMMESLPEDVQDIVAENIREYLEDLQKELKIDTFNKNQQKFIDYAQITKREITQELAKPMDKKLSLSESIAKFRQELINEEIEINPDYVWENIRNYSPGREVVW